MRFEKRILLKSKGGHFEFAIGYCNTYGIIGGIQYRGYEGKELKIGLTIICLFFSLIWKWGRNDE